MRRLVKDVLLPVGVAVGLAFVIQATVAKPYAIPTGSMIPTIEKKDRIIANRLIYHVRDIERGDIIVFNPPESAWRSCPPATPDVPFVKRVIGLPGDTVEVRDGLTLVNGEPYEVEDARDPNYVEPEVRVPEDRLWVLGDNRSESCDSAKWDPDPFVPFDNVIGQAEVTYWPPTSIKFLS